MQVGYKIVFDRYQWRVLDIQDDSALILTEKMLDYSQFQYIRPAKSYLVILFDSTHK